MKVGLITFFLLIFIQAKTQQKIDFQFAFNANAITLNKTIPFLADSITFSKIAVYLSSPEINFYQLVNAENDKSLQLDFEEIGSNTFYLGVDSLTNSNGAMGGDLDPTKGMYWTWQTGYIHFKLEGNIICDSSRKSFEYHIGGYSSNDSSPFFVGHKSIGNELQVTLDIYPAIQLAMKKEVFRIMSPGKRSDQMAQAILSGISIK